MRIVSKMVAAPTGEDAGGDVPATFKTTAGYEVVVRDEAMVRALRELERGGSRPVSALFEPRKEVAEDLVLLHRNGAVELLLWESPVPLSAVLSERERAARGEYTSPQHTRVAAPPEG
jgi:hypothetical protein